MGVKKKKAISFKINYLMYFSFPLFPQIVRESVLVYILHYVLQSLHITSGYNYSYHCSDSHPHLVLHPLSELCLG